jgi:hypothetical protein
MTQITYGYLAVPVPKDATEFYVLGCDNREGQGFFWKQSDQRFPNWTALPPGSWQFLFTTDGVTEEQAASVVQLISNGKISGRPQYRRYDRNPPEWMPSHMWTRDPRHSLETLIKSKGLPECNYAVLFNQNK